MSLADGLYLAAFLVSTELLYLRFARYFGLFDLPTQRGMHQQLTIVRGGGIIFYLAALITLLPDLNVAVYFLIGLTAVALISFWDDLYTVPVRYRLGIHALAVSLLLQQTGVSPLAWWALFGLLFFGVGLLNAYNFMDGINGMTALYSLVTIGTLWYWFPQLTSPAVDQRQMAIFSALFPSISIALLVFSYFNVRRQAICFAGDVGSLSVGFIILYALLQLSISHRTALPFLVLVVYGVDSGLTLLYRLYLGHTIVQPHRLHLFQRLVHRLKWPHVQVAALYAAVQLGINSLVITATDWSKRDQLILMLLTVVSLAAVYALLSKELTRAPKKA